MQALYKGADLISRIKRFEPLSGEWSYFLPLLEIRAGQERVLSAVAAILAEESIGSSFSAVCAFLRDAYLEGPGEVPRQAFRKALLNSSVPIVLAQAITSPRFGCRLDAIYMVGKIGILAALPTLRAAFDSRCDTDPLLLTRLLGEMAWLEGKKERALQRERIQRAADSKSYLTRWAVVQIAKQFAESNEADLLNCLADDPDLRVAREAQFEREHLHLRGTTQDWSRADRHRAFQQLRASKPKLFFRDVEFRFGNDMAERGADDYTPVELDVFVRRLDEPVHEKSA